MDNNNDDEPFNPSNPSNSDNFHSKDFDNYWNEKKRLDDELDDFFRDYVPKKRMKLMDKKPIIKNIPKCDNPLCDHKKYLGEEDIIWQETNEIKIQSIDNVRDLIELGKLYHCRMRRYFNGIDLRILFDIKEHLEELDKMIGLSNVKEEVVNLIIHLLLLKNKNETGANSTNITNTTNTTNPDMLHCVITGSPGCGKTTFIEIYAKILTKLGITKSSNIVKVKRSDLIGKYLGHTAAKTQAVIDECSGGVMFIDEAYALGNSEGRDSFSKECIDTINQNLTERRDFLCIIAGYKDALDNCFFNYNEGLRRRFTFRYDIEAYSPSELKDIFKLKVNKEGWSSEYEVKEGDSPENVMRKHELEQKVTSFFDQNMESFPHYGGDVETFFFNCKIVHGKRVMFLKPEDKKVLTEEDIEMGFNEYISCRKYKETDERKKHELNRSMFY